MAEYIDREVLKERITAEKDAHDTDTPYLVAYNNGLTMAYAMVVAMPTADVEVVKHGRWEDGKCTVCDFDIRGLTDGESDLEQWVWGEGLPHCPNCGCKMDLGG